MATKTKTRKPTLRRYQGREKTSILQADTKAGLDALIKSSRAFAKANDMEDFKVVKRGKDPDGGYKAIVTAHNWNPVKWVKEKIEARRSRAKVVDEDEVPKDAAGWEGVVLHEKERQDKSDKDWEERREKEASFTEAEKIMAARFQQAGFNYGDLRKQGDVSRMHRAYEAVKRFEERTFAEKAREVAYGHGPEQDILERMSPREQRKAARAVKEAERGRLYGDIDIYAQEVPSEVMTLQRSYVGGHWIDRATGKPAPEPQTAEEKAKLDWVPPGQVYTQVPRKLTAIEQRQVAREMRVGEMKLKVAEAEFKDWESERRPGTRVARGVAKAMSKGAGVMQHVAGTATLGMAGTAQAMLPRGRPSQARGLAPRPMSGIYTIRTPPVARPMPGLYSVRTPPVVGGGGVAQPRDNLGALRAAMLAGPSHLRAATLPGGMRAPAQPARRIPLAGQPKQMDLSGLRKRRIKKEVR